MSGSNNKRSYIYKESSRANCRKGKRSAEKFTLRQNNLTAVTQCSKPLIT